MEECIIINPRYRCEAVEGGVILYSERKNTIISDSKICSILTKISDGFSTEESLIDVLHNCISAPEVLYFIRKLEKNNIIVKRNTAYSDQEAAFWSELDMDMTKLFNVLEKKHVSIKAIHCDESLDIFKNSFMKNRISISENSELDIIITDDYERHDFKDINHQALGTGKKWMLIKPSGTFIWIGPIFEPGKTGCWKCLEQRLTLNRSVNSFVKSLKTNKEKKIISPMSNLGLEIAANITSLEVIKYLYFTENKNLEGKLLSFDSDKLVTQVHKLVKRPQCKVCGDINTIRNIQNKFVLLDEDEKTNLTYDGGFRTVLPESTIKKYEHHISNITGVVQILEQIPDIEDSLIFNYFSGANTALRSDTLYWLNTHIRSFSGGKGKNHSQAKAGALCEAIERYSCSYQGDEDVINARYIELGEKAIHPYNCLNFSKNQYENRKKANAECLKYYFMIPNEFNENENVDWVKVYLVGSSEYKYVPATYCFYQYPIDESKSFCYSDSNGNAAGNTVEEAILQGLLELVERDSVAIWWYNMLNQPLVDIQSFDDSYFNQLIGYYNKMNRLLYVIDLSFDLKIPCFAAISVDCEGKKPIIGFGAHTNAKIAVERALVELNQFLPILYGKNHSKDLAIINWINTATLHDQKYLNPLEGKIMTYNDYQNNCKNSIKDSIKYCMMHLKQRGMDVYFINMTKPDIELPVVKVIVPGLRHFWKRLGPGRLYDIPVEMGLLKESRREEEMNPITFFF